MKPEEKMDDSLNLEMLELELFSSLSKHYAGSSALKQRILRERALRRQQHQHTRTLQRLAASVVLAVAAGGTAIWHHQVQEHRQQQAAEQLMTALRVTTHALDNVHDNLTRNDTE